MLALASTVILGSRSHGTHDHILLSDGSGNLQITRGSDTELNVLQSFYIQTSAEIQAQTLHIQRTPPPYIPGARMLHYFMYLHTKIRTYGTHILHTYIHTYIHTHTHTRIPDKWNMGNGPRKMQQRTQCPRFIRPILHPISDHTTVQTGLQSQIPKRTEPKRDEFYINNAQCIRTALGYFNEGWNVQFKLQIFCVKE
jgi:hypothetical protein